LLFFTVGGEVRGQLQNWQGFIYSFFGGEKGTKGKQRMWPTGGILFPDLIFLQFPFIGLLEYVFCPLRQ